MTAKAHLRRKIKRWTDAAVFALLAAAGLAMLAFMVWVFQITLTLPH
jgi:uncharacterized membrane protein